MSVQDNISIRFSSSLSTKDQIIIALEKIWNSASSEKWVILPNLDDFLKETNFASLPNNSKTILTSISKQDIQNSLQHYFDICKKNKFESFSDISKNKCILDPLGNPISDINNIRIDISEVNDWMLNELNKNPTDLYKLSSRRFEELVAEIFIRKGYNVELTSATRDGGKDIYVARKDDLGSFLYIVECKQYKPTHKVGVNVLRDLYGVLSKERATYGVAVTTSYFSKPAQDFQQELQFQMSLKDFDSIKQWLYDVT